MLVKELRNEIKKYDRKKLEDIIVELYKRIPKSKKEDYDIDEYIKNINSKTGKSSKKVEFSFDDLQKEIIYFLNCVDNGYYCMPNKVISKKDRSTWRFKVKKYYKELNNILPDSENGDISTKLLIEIFIRLSTGSNRLLFSNFETFRALGVSQGKFYDVIIKRIMCDGYLKEKLEECINLLHVDKDPYEYSVDMFETLMFNLQTFANKEDAINILNEEIKKFDTKLKDSKNNHVKFELKNDKNDFVSCVTNIYFDIEEVDKGIAYFHRNYVETIKEVKEYILLELLNNYDLTKEWVKEYEKHIGKIDYRDSLKQQYNEFIKCI